MTGNAGPTRHAAWQDEYEVRELSRGEPPLELGVRCRCSTFLDAADFVLDYLDAHDPAREGVVGGLEIVRVRGGEREVVSAYRREEAERALDLAAHWGFPVTAWRGVPDGRRPR